MSAEAPVQPDLFGEYDAQQERDRLADQPATCPRCGTTEPNGHLLELNHGMEPGEDTVHGAARGEHSIFGDYCTAQYLTSNHIHYDAIHGTDDDLARAVARGRALGLDTDAIVAQARQDRGER
ncbi:hypothetical protein GCM10027447_12610 [Glycomyces halotolerans]